MNNMGVFSGKALKVKMFQTSSKNRLLAQQTQLREIESLREVLLLLLLLFDQFGMVAWFIDEARTEI